VYPEIKPILKKLEEVYSLSSALGLKIGINDPILAEPDIKLVTSVLRSNHINDIVGYFQNHRPTSSYSKINDEYKVQDLIYMVLSPIISDLHYEDPLSKPRGGIAFSRIDFSSAKLELLIEVKYVDSGAKARAIEAEMAEDITKYGRSRKFSWLIFYIYSSNYSFAKKAQFEHGFTAKHSIDGNQFNTICIIN